jgi:hypothetical protein
MVGSFFIEGRFTAAAIARQAVAGADIPRQELTKKEGKPDLAGLPSKRCFL